MATASPDQLLSDFDTADITELLPVSAAGEDLAPKTTANLDPELFLPDPTPR